MSSLTVHRVSETLRRTLHGPLPGPVAQMTMAPEHRSDLVRAQQADRPTRQAAVLVAIAGAREAKVVLTQRRSDLKYHPGQISFPGGRREPEEELLETALRESREEVGLASEQVTILGKLSPLYVPPSRFCVHPFVGVVEGTPALTAADDEVSRIILADLHRLCDPAVRRTENRTLNGRSVTVPYFALDGEKIWGATAMMIAELVAALER